MLLAKKGRTKTTMIAKITKATKTTKNSSSTLLRSKIFTFNSLFKACIISTVGYITRRFINDIYDVYVFKDYTVCFSTSYYLLVASVSFFINENFTVNFKGINFLYFFLYLSAFNLYLVSFTPLYLGNNTVLYTLIFIKN